jgi:hypothetical protein
MNRSAFHIIPRKTVYAIVVAIALSSAYAGASLALGSDDQRAACTPDVFRLCSSEIPNVDHIVVCLNVKKASLSQACKAVFTTPETSPKKVRNPAGPTQR